MSYNTLAPQFALVPDPQGEVAVAQYSGSTIPAFAAVVIDSTNQLRGYTPASGVTNPPALQNMVSLGVPIPANTFENMAIAVMLAPIGSPATGSLGILREALPSGSQRVACITRSVCCPATAAGSISAKNLLSLCTVSGKQGRLQVAVTGEEIVAQALTDASDGDTFLVRLFGSVSIHA